jgi:Polyketide cyclase / dehydrase and lipid transport
MRGLGLAAAAAAAGGVGYRLLVSGALTLDTGWGRTVRPLGPFDIDIAASPEVVFDVIAAPYLERTPRAMAAKLEVIERGQDMVLAAHRTPIRAGLVATTLETVRFHRPSRVDFRLVRGPVPHVVEHFLLHARNGGTNLEYGGELGADLWAAGRWWADQVARTWEATVRSSFTSIKAEAERRDRVNR